jgi:hypothetical protein
MTPAEPKIPLTVYLPAALRQQVEHEAREDRRTLSVCVELVLTKHFKAKATRLVEPAQTPLQDYRASIAPEIGDALTAEIDPGATSRNPTRL